MVEGCKRHGQSDAAGQAVGGRKAKPPREEAVRQEQEGEEAEEAESPLDWRREAEAFSPPLQVPQHGLLFLPEFPLVQFELKFSRPPWGYGRRGTRPGGVQQTPAGTPSGASFFHNRSLSPPRPAAARAEAPLAARWLEYLHTCKPFDVPRDQAEAVALATSLDMLINGDYLRCGDLLTQRFKALELSTQTTWRVASQLELTEPRRALLTSRDVAQATKAAAQQSRLDRQVSGWKP